MSYSSQLPPRRQPSLQLNNTINITPFVDVMLVLLVVFMITAPLLSMGVALDLPKTSAANLAETEEPLVISIDAGGVIYLQEVPIEEANLIARLKAMSQANPDLHIYIRGDTQLAYGSVLAVMGRISEAGFVKVVLLSNPPEDV